MSVETTPMLVRETLADLDREPGKAELIGGRIVRFMGTGFRPNLVAGQIYRKLAGHADVTGQGFALADKMGFAVPELASSRESFSPVVAYFDGQNSTAQMGFIQGPPTFAVAVRREKDCGPAAERAIEAKRADSFESGTLVVWDVDPKANSIKDYRSVAPNQPQVFAWARSPMPSPPSPAGSSRSTGSSRLESPSIPGSTASARV